ncbi:hypothetical protein FVEG_05518 [Fusarium verticillioides 7600]|uniref:Uncharacterized protein n=1 Tax=Gibberella moniliformis (strain M3125 / FGSC 7600) TaxID=334819 RepID=W7MI42_GIBM7|nr:hypothetical protein FVEG_05518 [Fusarium verticillioides 7600]EWG44472.1 hypothetical protein FVEG_05518 [Fusarium verticillioides 7600]
METVKFEDEGPLAPLFNATTWPGLYSSFLPLHHFTSQSQSQSLPLCQQPFFSFEPCHCASSFTSSQTSSLGYSDCFLHHPPPNLPPPILSTPNIYRSLYQARSHQSGAVTILYTQLPLASATFKPPFKQQLCLLLLLTQLPSPPLSSTPGHHQETMSSSPVSSSRKSPAAGAAQKSPAAEVGGSLGGLSRVLPAQARAQKILEVLAEYEITSPALIQRLMPLPVSREEKRAFVRLLRLHDVSYADIKNLGELSTSLSTLRGWDRMKKPAADRPRTPRWTTRDVFIMKQSVTRVLGMMDIGSPGFWRRVEEEMVRGGASHPFSAQAIAAKYDGRSRGDIARLKASTRAQ